MAQDTIKKIAEYKTRLADLERELFAQLAKLPAQYGFASAEDFIAAFRRSVAGKPGRKPGKAAKAPAAKKTASGRKARVKITPEIEAQVKSLAEAGKTGNQIAAATGISLPSVQNLKKKLGLVAKKK
jgi:DNA-binding NarL/FixJ family response regulator